jgi:hypothetical protein
LAKLNFSKRMSRKKEVTNTVLENLKTEKDGYCRVRHKRGWLGFLKDGDPVFSPEDLNRVLKEVVGSEQMKPKGEKLFYLNRHFDFTAKEDGTPYRPEEALERFIVVSNQGNFYDQVPIGGRRESIDIGVKENDSKITFVELKPWLIHDSPLYAMVESLKNLIEYRTILDQGIKDIPRFDRIDLTILAPKEYYQAYQLIDESGTTRRENLIPVEKMLRGFSGEFKAGMSLKYLELEEKSFIEKCRAVYNARGAKGQEKVCLESTDSIPALAFERWKILVSTG